MELQYCLSHAESPSDNMHGALFSFYLMSILILITLLCGHRHVRPDDNVTVCVFTRRQHIFTGCCSTHWLPQAQPQFTPKLPAHHPSTILEVIPLIFVPLRH